MGTTEFEALSKPGRPGAEEVDAVRARELARLLDEALKPEQTLAPLATLRFSDALVGTACGHCSPATVSNWRAGRRSPNEQAADRLDQLRVVVSYLVRNLADYFEQPGEVARLWLTKRREWPPESLPRRAVDQLAESQFEVVYRRAEQFIHRLHGRPELH
jgi:hypothetical protein